MYPAKMNHRTGGQFGAQRILCKVVNHGTGGQFGAQGSIGFRGGYEKGKSAGTYAVRKNLKASQREINNCLQKRLPLHNQFISNRLRDFSEATLEENKAALKEFGMASWSNETWKSFKNEPSPLFSNAIVTTNDFSNKPHCDKIKTFSHMAFSIRHSLVSRALKLKKLSEAEKKKRTTNQAERSALKLKKLSKAEKKKRTTNQAERSQIKRQKKAS
ncbi:hypothetical protein PSHT_14679, partial [Puccinia striiformis]